MRKPDALSQSAWNRRLERWGAMERYMGKMEGEQAAIKKIPIKPKRFAERNAAIIEYAKQGMTAAQILPLITDRWPTKQGGKATDRECVQRVITDFRREERKLAQGVQK